MKPCNFESMATDELWAFHEQICLALSAKVADRKGGTCTAVPSPLSGSRAVAGSRRPEEQGCTATLPPNFSEIPKSAPAVGNVVRARQAAALADCGAQVRQTDGQAQAAIPQREDCSCSIS